MKENFTVHYGQNGKFYVVGFMGEEKMMLPLSKKDLAKKVAYDLNKQLMQYTKDFVITDEKEQKTK